MVAQQLADLSGLELELRFRDAVRAEHAAYGRVVSAMAKFKKLPSDVDGEARECLVDLISCGEGFAAFGRLSLAATDEILRRIDILDSEYSDTHPSEVADLVQARGKCAARVDKCEVLVGTWRRHLGVFDKIKAD